MSDPNYELLFRALEENWNHARLSEEKRAWVANLALLLTAALHIALAVVGLHRQALPLTIMLLIVAVYGALTTVKLYERAQFHIRRARSLRARLDELCPDAQVEQLQRAAEQEHRKHYPRLADLRLNVIWLSLYGLIGALGIVYTVICLVR